MKFRKHLLKIILNLFPPLFFNRIVVKNISDDYLEMDVVLKKTFFNINFHKTIFGGSIFSACDPFFPTMYYNIFKLQDRKLIIWVKNAEINYLLPANTSLKLKFQINNSHLSEIEKNLQTNGKCEIKNEVEAKNKNNEICASAIITTYLRDSNFMN